MNKTTKEYMKNCCPRDKDEIKKVYDEIQEMINQNPRLYIMDISQYNRILSIIENLRMERARLIESRDLWMKKFKSEEFRLKNRRIKELTESRDNWRKKCEELKNTANTKEQEK